MELPDRLVWLDPTPPDGPHLHLLRFRHAPPSSANPDPNPSSHPPGTQVVGSQVAARMVGRQLRFAHDFHGPANVGDGRAINGNNPNYGVILVQIRSRSCQQLYRDSAGYCEADEKRRWW